MRKICCRYLEKELALDSGIFYDVVIENPDQYYRFLSELRNQMNGLGDGPFCYSENENEKPLPSKCGLITDYFGFDVSDRKIITQLYRQLQSGFRQSNLSERFFALSTQMVQLMDELGECSPIPLSFDEEVDFQSFLKLMDAKPSLPESSFLEKLVEYFDIYASLMGIDVFWLADIKSFLSEPKLELLIKEANLKKINLINIENRLRCDIMVCEEVIVIDKDLCEFHPKRPSKTTT